MQVFALSPELEGAVLPVEGEVVDVDGAGTTEDGRGQPVDIPVRVHQHIAVIGHLELCIIAMEEEEGSCSKGAAATNTVSLVGSLHRDRHVLDPC